MESISLAKSWLVLADYGEVVVGIVLATLLLGVIEREFGVTLMRCSGGGEFKDHCPLEWRQVPTNLIECSSVCISCTPLRDSRL